MPAGRAHLHELRAWDLLTSMALMDELTEQRRATILGRGDRSLSCDSNGCSATALLLWSSADSLPLMSPGWFVRLTGTPLAIVLCPRHRSPVMRDSDLEAF